MKLDQRQIKVLPYVIIADLLRKIHNLEALGTQNDDPDFKED